MKETGKLQFAIKESIYKQSIDVLDLSVRAFNCVKRAGMNTIEDILDRQSELYSIRSCGANTVKEIKNKILRLQQQQEN